MSPVIFLIKENSLRNHNSYPFQHNNFKKGLLKLIRTGALLLKQWNLDERWNVGKCNTWW